MARICVGQHRQRSARIKTKEGPEDASGPSTVHKTVGSFVHCIEACLQQIDLSMLSIDCTPLIGAQERHSEMLQSIDNSADKLRPEVVLAWDGKRCKDMEAVKQTGRNASPWTSWRSQRSNAERSIDSLKSFIYASG